MDAVETSAADGDQDAGVMVATPVAPTTADSGLLTTADTVAEVDVQPVILQWPHNPTHELPHRHNQSGQIIEPHVPTRFDAGLAQCPATEPDTAKHYEKHLIQPLKMLSGSHDATRQHLLPCAPLKSKI